MPSEEKTLLYYPTIKIEDGRWLRNALLYWDKVSSIVPSCSFLESNLNSAEIEFLMSEGIYEPIYPISLGENESLLSEFNSKIREIFESRRESASGRTSRVHRDKMALVTNDIDPANVYLEKMPSGTLDYLVDKGIAWDDDSHVWLNMRSKDAEVYMATLAKYLARARRNTEIGTDSSSAYLYPFSGGKTSTSMDVKLGIDVALQRILPCPKKDVPYERILDFKRENEEILRGFRLRIERYQIDLSRCASMEELATLTRHFQEEMDYNLHQIDKMMRQKKYGIIRSTLHIATALGANYLSAYGLEKIGVSSMGASIAGDIAEAVVSQFFTKRDSITNEDRAFLFKARTEGIIC